MRLPISPPVRNREVKKIWKNSPPSRTSIIRADPRTEKNAHLASPNLPERPALTPLLLMSLMSRLLGIVNQ